MHSFCLNAGLVKGEEIDNRKTTARICIKKGKNGSRRGGLAARNMFYRSRWKRPIQILLHMYLHAILVILAGIKNDLVGAECKSCVECEQKFELLVKGARQVLVEWLTEQGLWASPDDRL